VPKNANLSALLSPQLPPLLTRRDLATACGVTTRTIQGWLDAGLLPPSMRVGGRDLWTPELLRRHFARAEEGAARAK
jgi:hypothetical protein